jgi:hypothetical protein
MRIINNIFIAIIVFGNAKILQTNEFTPSSIHFFYLQDFDFLVYSVYVLPYSSRLIDLFFAAALLLIAGPGANLTWLLAGAAMGRFLKDYRRQVGWVMVALLAACAVMVFIE